jgi:hypothetical protein
MVNLNDEVITMLPFPPDSSSFRHLKRGAHIVKYDTQMQLAYRILRTR